MLLKDFPDLQWIRKQSRSNFDERKDAQGNRLSQSGWPSVILNTRAQQEERDGILGPFSIFLNLSGQSVLRSEKNVHRVNDGFYYVSNHGQEYDLHIPESGQTETFNIHFGEELYQEVLNTKALSEVDLLDQGSNQNRISHEFYPKLQHKSLNFNTALNPLIKAASITQNPTWSAEREYELLSTLLDIVLDQNAAFLKRSSAITSAKKSTQTELLLRVSTVIDFLHDHSPQEVTLHQMSLASGLSRFHLLRVFKQVVGCTPQQYAAQLRLERAMELLKLPSISPSQASLQLGFSELPAFTRFIKRHVGLTPTDYQASLKISNLG